MPSVAAATVALRFSIDSLDDSRLYITLRPLDIGWHSPF